MQKIGQKLTKQRISLQENFTDPLVAAMREWLKSLHYVTLGRFESEPGIILDFKLASVLLCI